MTSVGTMPVRKSIQEPACSGFAPSLRVRPVPAPGLVSRPIDEADRDGDQRGDHEPEKGAGGQPRGVVDLPQVGDRHQDGEEDERRDGQLQQLDEDVADLLERLVEPVDVLAAGEPAEEDTDDEAGDDLGPERDLGYAAAGTGGRRGVRGHGHLRKGVSEGEGRGCGAPVTREAAV